MAERSRSRAGQGVLVFGYASYGAFWGSYVVVFADFLRDHDLSFSQVSLGFTAMSVISILLMTFLAPRLEPMARNISVAVALTVHAIGCAAIALLPTELLVIAFVLMGAGTGLIDVFVNAAGNEIEQRSQAPVLQWLHASYGAGGFVGSLLTGLALTGGAPFRAALVVAAAAQGAAAVAAWRSRALSTTGEVRPGGRMSLSVFVARPSLLAPALVVMFAFFVEGSMDVWSVLFLRETLGSSVLGGAAGFAAFALALTLGRSFAAQVLFGLGYRRTVVLSGIGSLSFGLIAVVAENPWVAGIAFLGLGFSLSAAAPAAFGMSEAAGVNAGLAVGAITTVGYTGFVVGPPVMGWIADNMGLRASFGVLLVATVGVAASGLLSRAPTRAPAAAKSTEM